jgi:hypothetical protein
MAGSGAQPTLTDVVGMGGVIAQGGFDYQLWDGLARLPGWLANPAFEELIFEGLEDLEARFFAPQAPRGRLLERYQAKSGGLTPKDVTGILNSFLKFDAAYPELARLHTLVTPRLPSTLAFVGRDTARVRKARPFYAPFADIAKASDAQLRADLIAEFGPELGEFVAQAVEVEERVLPERDSALQAFGLALHRAFPDLEASAGKIETAFEALSGLARRSIGKPLGRSALAGVLTGHLGRLMAEWRAFPLHVRSDRNEINYDALEINASGYSGGYRPFPDPSAWAFALVAPLAATAKWLRSRGSTRVALSGSYRLTTAFALGWSFRSSIGFELEIPTRGGTWATDDRPAPGESFPAWQVTEATSLDEGRLAVSVGIIRDPSADLLQGTAMPPTSLLRLHLPQPLTTAHAAQAGVATVKAVVAAAAAAMRPHRIDLYMAGPAAFSVALGHRWNAMPPTQFHEFVTVDRRYVATAVLC